MRRLATILALAAVAGCSSSDDRPVERLEMADVYVAFRDNPVAAEQRFAAARLQVTGKVDSVEAGADGKPELFLSAPHGGIASVDFSDGPPAQVAALERGAQVTVTCGRVHKAPTDQVFNLGDCRI
jgi:hypothetical protein